MRSGGQKRAVAQAWRRRFAGVLAIAIAVALVGPIVEGERWPSLSGGIFISPANAHKARKRSKGHKAHLQAAQKQVQSLTQIQAAQKQQQQAQQLLAAQQKHLQRIQQMVAAQKKAQQTGGSQPTHSGPHGKQPSALTGAPATSGPQPTNHSSAHHHHSLTQKVMAKIKASQQALTASTANPASASAQQGKLQALKTKLQNLKAKGHAHHQQNSASATSAKASGSHHKALLKAVAAKLSKHHHSLGGNAFSKLANAPAAGTHGNHHGNGHAKHALINKVLSKLNGHSGHGHHGNHHKAVFSHILAKLSKHGHRNWQKQQQAAPAPTPAPAPAPTTTKSTKTTPAPAVQVVVPPVTVPNTPLVSALPVVSKVLNTGSGNNGSGNEGANSSLLGTTISKLGGPQPPPTSSSADAGGGGPRQGNQGKRNDDDDQDGGVGSAVKNGVKPVLRSLGIGQTFEPLPTFGTYRPKEVLAINLNPASLKKVLGSKYKQIGKPLNLPGLGLTITRLETPPGENAVSGRGTLQAMVPDSVFALNRVYAPYRVGAGTSPKGAGSRNAPIVPGARCAADRCFGAALINWQPERAACARDVRIGIIDTGFDRAHPAFAHARYVYKEFLPEHGARASKEHGTGIFSLLAGGADTSTPGLAPDAVYSVANAFFADGSGNAVSDTAQMLAALAWLKDQRVTVANLSFAGPKDELVHHAIRELTRAGVVVVAAAGNDGPSAPPSYPAAYEEVIAVTAVDRNLAPYRYASRGPHIDVAAPGVGVWTALPGKREGTQTGTSFAVPYVTAVIAMNASAGGGLIRSGGDPRAPKRLTLALLQKDIKSLGPTGRDPTFGEGLVQAPAHCQPQAPVAVASKAPETKAPDWTGKVHRASAPPAGPAQLGRWISTTVRAVSAKGQRP
jgi:hypothetical protein